MNRIAAILGLTSLLAGTAAAVDQDLELNESGVNAAAQPTYSLTAEPTPIRLDFDFRAGETKAWVNKDGDFQIQGSLKHRGLLCGSYQMGIRFGIGSPACLNVEWITEPIFVTSQTQCNGARVMHLGGDNDPGLAAKITRITCAERIIRCSGNCR